MIKFFRKIRQKLLSENKFSKYLIYAVGEIILVVIGILIALQINNWNEAKKNEFKEVQIYKEILNDLNLTLEEVQKDLNSHKTNLKLGKILIDSLAAGNDPGLEHRKMIVQMLQWAYTDFQLYPKKSGFETLKSIGLDLLQNDSLRSNITDLYELDIKRVEEIGKLNPRFDIETKMEPFIYRHFVINKDTETFIEEQYSQGTIKLFNYRFKDFNALINDEEFLKISTQSLLLRIDKINLHQRAIVNLKEVIRDIESEIKVLDE